MTDFLIEAFGLLLRWLHVVAAIAWIGESFYFVALDRGLKPAKQEVEGLHGESWSVHGGGFYLKQKFLPAPAQLPTELHWSKWKSYTTWLSGFALFTVLYLLSPNLYLIDPAVAALGNSEAVLLALVFPVLGWFVYDLLCRALVFRDGLLSIAMALLVAAICYSATHLFSGRAAFLLAGATLATIMSANVFFVIIPGQKRMVAALSRRETPEPLDGVRGKQRSVHNTYFTLPVVFAMLSTHYATAFAHPQGWLVLLLFMAAGVLIRQFFVLWHSGGRAWWLLAAGAVVLAAVFAWLAPAAKPEATVAETTTMPSSTGSIPAAAEIAVDSTQILSIMADRCTACHSAQPTLVASAPKGTMFETTQQIETHAGLIHRQVVALRVMPPGNITGLTEVERVAIDRWYQSGQHPVGKGGQ